MFSRLIFAKLQRTETRLNPLWLTGFMLKTGKTVFFDLRYDILAQEKQKLVLGVRKVDFEV